MSFIQTTDGILTKTLWPDDIGCISNDDPTAQWQIIPPALDRLFDWAYVAKNHRSTDRKHSHHLLYKVPADVVGIFPVTVRIQGFIARCALSGLGTWNGSLDTAAAATHFLALSSGGYNEPWSANLSTIRNIRQMVHNSLPSRQRFIEPEAEDGSELYIRRRIFTKVPEFGDRPISMLQPEDDPQGWCPAVNNEWLITSRLQVGKPNSLGVLVQCSPLLLTEGDFVDVAIEIDIASNGTPSRGGQVRAHLSMQHVILLAKASDAPQIIAPIAPVVATIINDTADVGMRHSNFTFDANGVRSGSANHVQAMDVNSL